MQDAAATAKKKLDEAAAVDETAKVLKNATKELKTGEKEIEVKKEVKAKKVAEQKPKAADLDKPWGTPAEVWTANMPDHHLEGYAQKQRKDIKEHELAQEEQEESESEAESEDEDSGDESDE